MDIIPKKIKGITLDEDTVILIVDMERRKIHIDGIVTTEYESILEKDKIERVPKVLRGTAYDQALMFLFPDNDNIIWKNPRKMVKEKVTILLAENID